MFLNTNLLYVLLILVLLSSCSKDEVSKSPDPNDYNLANFDLRQKGNTLVSGQKVKLSLLVRHYSIAPEKKGSAINKIEIVSGNSVVSSTSGFYLKAGDIDFKMTELETSALKTGRNEFGVRIHYEAGFYDTENFELFALKDRQLKTWWDGVSIEYLRNVKSTRTTAWPYIDGDRHGYTSSFDYGNRNDEYLNIDGLYGMLLTFYEPVSLKLNHIVVVNGSFQRDPTLSMSAVREDIYKAFPDCVITTDVSGMVITMKSREFTFVITNSQNTLVTRVTKN